MDVYRSHFDAMGGTNEILISSPDKAAAVRAIELSAQEALRIQAKYSRYRADSVVSRINAAAGSNDFIECDDETLRLLECANTLYDNSDGLFDATSGILRKAWDFKKAVVPSHETLDPLLALIGWDKVQRRGTGIRLPMAGMEIDFGGFGKEYAADCAAKVILDSGVHSGYVNFGGDICAIGPDADGQPWLIGVGDPRKKGAIIATLPVTKGGLATSSNSEKYIEVDGQIYCHILNAKTGMPVSYWSSATVRAPTALAAGAISTIAMLKEAAAAEFLKDTVAPYLFVDLNGQYVSNQPLAN